MSFGSTLAASRCDAG